MSAKASVATLLLLSLLLLTGCNICFGTRTRSVQASVDKIETAGDSEPQKSSARLEEDLRLATERARLAEEKAALEKQKRKFSEERLKQLEKSDKEGQESSGDEAAGES